ncbi:MAG: hypothetical protein AAGC58_01570 [Asticcacaulis sp.]
MLVAIRSVEQETGCHSEATVGLITSTEEFLELTLAVPPKPSASNVELP